MLVAAFSEANSLDTQPCAPLSSTPTPDQFYWPDKPTEHSRLSRFGMTCEPLMAIRGEELLTWYLAGFPARTSALPGKAPESPEREADYGATWRGSLAKYDHDSRSWKTAQLCLLGESESSSVIWPRSGMTRGGLCWELPTLERPTYETGSGYSPRYPTPNIEGYRSDGELKLLAAAVTDRTEYEMMASRACRSKKERFFPTPTTQDNAQIQGQYKTNGTTLAGFVRMFPTATATATASKGSSPASLVRKSGKSREYDRLDHFVLADSLRTGVSGHLNAEWQEWLMGWPIGATALKPLETAKYREFERQHGECLEAPEC